MKHADIAIAYSEPLRQGPLLEGGHLGKRKRVGISMLLACWHNDRRQGSPTIVWLASVRSTIGEPPDPPGQVIDIAGGCFVLHLLNRKPPTHVRPFSPGGTEPLPFAGAATTPAISSTGHYPQHPHPIEIARALNGTYSRVLVHAVTPTLMGTPEPYVPETADDMRVAQWLALPVVGLLIAEWAGYAACYRPTPLGRAVVHAMLADAVVQQQDGAAGTGAAPVGYSGTQPTQRGWNGGRHAR